VSKSKDSTRWAFIPAGIGKYMRSENAPVL